MLQRWLQAWQRLQKEISTNSAAQYKGTHISSGVKYKEKILKVRQYGSKTRKTIKLQI